MEASPKQKITTILIKLKYQEVLFENIQGFISNRHYILPYLICNDKIYQKKLRRFNGIIKDNKLSSNFINNLFTFISDRILFKIINKEEDIFDNNSNYYTDIEDKKSSIFKILQKRIFHIYKSCRNYNETNINIENLKKFFPKGKEFALFLFDYFQTKNKNTIYFKTNHLSINFDIKKFFSYYKKIEPNEEEEENNQISNDNNNEMEKYYYKLNRKNHIHVAFIGNLNSGKSTTIGHLLYSTGNITKYGFQKIENLAQNFGKSEHKYSWLMDKLLEERENDKTTINHLKKFETEKYNFTLIDLPGDFKYIKNIMRGLSLADVVVIIVSTDDQENDNDHIKDYLILTRTMGIKKIIVAINKMDKANYSENIFIKIKKDMKKMCEKIGFNDDNIQFIGYSGYTGQNLLNRYEDEDKLKINKMEWYKGGTLLESLNKIKPPKRPFDKPLIISISGVYKITGVGNVLCGKILSGYLKTGMELSLNCYYKYYSKIKCCSIKTHDKNIDEAFAGDYVGFNIKGFTIRDLKGTRLVIGGNDSLKKVQNFRVKILMINKTKTTLRNGSELFFYCYTTHFPINIVKIEYIIDGKK